MREYQSGQILLIIVLVMVTALTVGLSVAARSVTNTRTSEDSSDSEKAFSAAEAGVEQSLTSDSSISTTTFSNNNSSYKTTVVNLSGTTFQMNNGSPILQDDLIDLWLSGYPGYTNPWSGTFTLYWGQTSDVCSQSETNNTMAALEVIVLSGTTTNPQMARYAFDPCTARQAKNNFLPANTSNNGYSIAGGTYAYSSNPITVTSGLVAGIIPLYAPTEIAVKDSASMPSQGTVITATGNSGDTERRIEAYRIYPKLPVEIFQYSLFVP